MVFRVSKGFLKENAALLSLFEKQEGGILSTIHKVSSGEEKKMSSASLDSEIVAGLRALAPVYNQITVGHSCFSVRHGLGTVEYDTDGMASSNMDSISPDFILLCRGDGKEFPPCDNLFVQALFSENILALEQQTPSQEAEKFLVRAQHSATSPRHPSIKRKKKNKKGEEDKKAIITTSIVHDFQTSLRELLDALLETNPWFVFCFNPNETRTPLKLDQRKLKVQTSAYQIPAIAAAQAQTNFTASYTFETFCELFGSLIDQMNISESSVKKVCTEFARVSDYNQHEFAISDTKVFVSESAWRSINNQCREVELRLKQEMKSQQELTTQAAANGKRVSLANQQMVPGGVLARLRDDASFIVSSADGASAYDTDADSVYAYESPSTSDFKDMKSPLAGAKDLEAGYGPGAQDAFLNNGHVDKDMVIDDKPPTTSARKKWVCLTWCLTWWIPSFFLSCCGGMKRRDVRMASTE